MAIIRVLILCGVTGLTIWKICWYIGYLYAVNHRTCWPAKMKWGMIKKLYPINPKKWSYSYDNHIYYTEEDMRVLFYDKTPIHLSFIDYQKLRFWSVMQKYLNERKEKREALAEILEDAQKDIEKVKKQAKKQMDEANVIMVEVTKK